MEDQSHKAQMKSSTRVPGTDKQTSILSLWDVVFHENIFTLIC